MAKHPYIKMGIENLHCQKNRREMYPIKIRVIQLEFIFLQLVTMNMGYLFAGVEKLLRETFLPHIFFRKLKSLTPIVGTLITILVKKADLGIKNSVMPVEKNS